MNKILPIILVVVLSGCASQTTINKPYIIEYTSNAKQVLGDCINLDCELADKICGKKNDSGVRKLDEDDCRMAIARYKMETKNTSTLEPPTKDPCVKMDCSVNSELASNICLMKSGERVAKLDDGECRMQIKRYQKRVINGESHEDAMYFSVKEYDYNKGWKGFFNYSDKIPSYERERAREAREYERVIKCAAALKNGVYKDKSDYWRRDKCRKTRRY